MLLSVDSGVDLEEGGFAGTTRCAYTPGGHKGLLRYDSKNRETVATTVEMSKVKNVQYIWEQRPPPPAPLPSAR